MAKKLTRRGFIKVGLILSGGFAALLARLFTGNPIQPGLAQMTNTKVHLPFVSKNATPTPQPASSKTPIPPPGTIGARYPGRVVQAHASNAHTWDYTATNYWDYLNQSVVNDMVDQGVMGLTGKSSASAAWRALLPNYQPGQVVAIKVSFNNTYNDAGSTGMIDGIVEPVNAIIRGLRMAGVSDNSSIVVFDSSRCLPTRFTSGCDYPGVLFRHKDHDPWGEGSQPITFSPPDGSPFTQRLSKEVVQADYLINVPIMKLHGMEVLVSLAMKNHYGSIEKPSDLHHWISGYNPILEINKSPHIANKTILTVGDGIFAALHNWDQSFPRGWKTFSNQTPKSLFFATDPVSIDCVMGDLLNAEQVALGKGEMDPKGFAYMVMAEAAGLGVYERGNPWLNTYSKIELIKREI